MTETVTVEGTAPLLESQTSSIGQVITNDYVRNIPLNGRNPYALGLLAGHTTPTYGTSADGLPFVAGGGRYTSNEVLLDGVDNNSYINRGIAYAPTRGRGAGIQSQDRHLYGRIRQVGGHDRECHAALRLESRQRLAVGVPA